MLINNIISFEQLGHDWYLYLTTNELVKQMMLWTTGPGVFWGFFLLFFFVDCVFVLFFPIHHNFDCLQGHKSTRYNNII